jgi:hypothetical protein
MQPTARIARVSFRKCGQRGDLTAATDIAQKVPLRREIIFEILKTPTQLGRNVTKRTIDGGQID